MSDRVANSHTVRISLMDMDWVSHPEYCGIKHPQTDNVEKPITFNKMVEIAKKLSSPFPFVRVDFYEVNQKPVFGEMTFTPGFDSVNMKFEVLIGEMIVL